MSSAVTKSATAAKRRPTTRGWDAATHIAPLVVAVLAAVAVGKPLGWIAFLFPVGPVVVAIVMRAAGRDLPRGFRSAVAFALGSGLLVGLGWLGTQAGNWISPMAFLFPVALLIFIVGLVNWLMIVLSRTVRAIKYDAFDYPWIPDRLARAVGLPMGWSE